jgi:aspartate-semialdehyde dehydrogenase
MAKKIKVGLLGSTGLVGQRLVEVLTEHPVFELNTLFGRDDKHGKPYYDVVNWVCSSKLDKKMAEKRICSIDDENACKGIELFFSALSAEAADVIEPKLRTKGFGIVSNARSFRMKKEVPLLVPEINANSIELVAEQKKKYNGGFIATNPNCSAIGISLTLAPIQKELGLESLNIVTMQAISGAGLKGLTMPEAKLNVIPNIANEEDKILEELPKIFGTNDIDIKVRVNRVNVVDGHTFVIWFKTKKQSSRKEMIELWKSYKPQCSVLPSISTAPVYKVYEGDDFMPQPKLDAWYMNGMGTAVGRLEEISNKEFCVTSVSNNIVRGAAGGTILIAETLHSRGMI